MEIENTLELALLATKQRRIPLHPTGEYVSDVFEVYDVYDACEVCAIFAISEDF